MKAISIQQPWAWLIVMGIKDVENRTWWRRYKGEVLIHASKQFAACDMEWIKKRIPMEMQQKFHQTFFEKNNYKLGGIVGKAEIVDWVDNSHSPWFEGPVGIVLQNAQVLEFAPCPGQLGLFDVNYDELLQPTLF